MDKEIKEVDLKFKAYTLIDEAVSDGIEYGFNRSYKHDNSPNDALKKLKTHEAIMLALTEIIDFP